MAPKSPDKKEGDSSSVEKAAERLLRAQEALFAEEKPAPQARPNSIEKSVEAAPLQSSDAGGEPPPASLETPEPPLAESLPPVAPTAAPASPEPPPMADVAAPSPAPEVDVQTAPAPQTPPPQSSPPQSAEAPPPPTEIPSTSPVSEPLHAIPVSEPDVPPSPAAQAGSAEVLVSADGETVEETSRAARLADRYRDAAVTAAAPGADQNDQSVDAQTDDQIYDDQTYDDGAEEIEDTPRKRRGFFGTVWAIVRFILIGSKRVKKPGRKPRKAVKYRKPAKPGAPGPAMTGRGARARGLLGRVTAAVPRIGRVRDMKVPSGIQKRLPNRISARLSGGEAVERPEPEAVPPTAQQLRRQSADGHILRPLDLSSRTGRVIEIDVDQVRADGMVTPSGERTQIAEEFRLIKRPLLLNAFEDGADAIRNGNVIMVASSRSGEGKTFTAINLAMSIASERDLTVLLIDADVAKPDINNVLNFAADRGLVDLIADEQLDVADVMLRTSIDNLSILPAGRGHHLATELLASDRMGKLVSELSSRYPERIIVMDSPPALQSSVAGVLALNVGQILFVVEAEKTAQTAVDSAIGLVSACKNINLLLNKSRPIGSGERFGGGYGGYY